MGLTSALNTSLNGLSLNETTIDTLGNNIANSGTNGFKASGARFQTQLSRTFSVGSRSSAESGGINPRQVGLGATVAVISRDFTQGSITNSTSPSDLAIEGNGFFILDDNGAQVYSRNGNFTVNDQSKLVNDQGNFVRGYGIDSNFNLVTTGLADIKIPIGDLQLAQQTHNISISGAFYPSGELATQGSQLTSVTLTDSSNSANATATSLLTNLRNPAGDVLFTSGTDVNFTPQKGGRSLDSNPLAVTATTTLQDYISYMQDTLGLQSGGTVPNDGLTGGQPGVTLAAGQIKVVGNAGTANDLDITSGNILDGTAIVSLTFNKSAAANGESTGTNFIVYDSLGTAINLRLTGVLESKGAGQSSYRYYVESSDENRVQTALTNGVISFDSLGKPTGNPVSQFSLPRTNTAAVNPLQVSIDFSQVAGISSATAGSKLNLLKQDGAAPGTLQSFTIDDTGTVNGVFDNGLIRTLGQVVLARFANQDGLVENGSTSFKEGVNSGTPFLVTPGTFGVGTLRAGAIELSNTDIGRSLVDLIVASTNYRGNARVISSVQQLVDELLLLGR